MGDSNLSILFCPKDSPALVKSAYAKIAQYVTPRLMDKYDVRLHCTVGHMGDTLTWTEPHSGKQLEIWSGGNGVYGEDIIPSHLQNLAQITGKPPLMLFLGDAIALGQIPQWARERKFAAAAWTAVDWEWPTPKPALDKLGGFLKAWPMSHHGHRVLAQDGLQNLGNPLWFGVNTDVWKPADRSQFPQAMESMGFREDTFNVISVFANQYQRKSEYEMFQAVGEFHKRHPEAKIRFFALTQARREWDLPALVEHLGLGEIVRLSDDYSYLMGHYTESDIAMMVNASDCVLSLGYEGFGMLTCEAQALEKPVIGFNAGATPELLRSGILVPPVKDTMLPNLLRRPMIDGPKIVEALERVYEARNDKKRWSMGRRWVLDNLTWDHCVKRLIGELTALEQQLADEDFWGPPAPGPKAIEMSKQLVTI